MEKLLEKKLEEWVTDSSKNNINPLVYIFLKIRDIPYMWMPTLINSKKGPIELLRINMGSCTPKNFLLGRMFSKLEIKIRYASYPFRWNEQRVWNKISSKMIIDKLPISYHVALHAFIENRWVVVDPSLDLPLKKAGLPVNDNWDGYSNTMIAFQFFDTIIHNNEDERVNYAEKNRSLHSEIEKILEQKFLEKINKWLIDTRSKYYGDIPP
jgi:hypothetical protein